MATSDEKEPKQPRKNRRALGLIVASTVAVAPSLGCSSTASPADGAAEMDAAVTADAGPSIDTATGDTATGDTATGDDAIAADDAPSGEDAVAAADAGDAADGDDAYPAGVRG